MVDASERARLGEHARIAVDGPQFEGDGPTQSMVERAHDDAARTSAEDALHDVSVVELRRSTPQEMGPQEVCSYGGLELRDGVHARTA